MYDNYKVWENYLYVSLEANELSDAIEAFRRVAEIKLKGAHTHIVDIELLLLTLPMILKKTEVDERQRLISKFGQLLDYLSAHTSNSDSLFKLCRDFYEIRSDYRKALEFQQKAYRILIHQPELEHDESRFKSAIQGALDMVHCYERLGPKHVPSRVSEDLEIL
jgi:tetratricopeptide (TPR) repeat protein